MSANFETKSFLPVINGTKANIYKKVTCKPKEEIKTPKIFTNDSPKSYQNKVKVFPIKLEDL